MVGADKSNYNGHSRLLLFVARLCCSLKSHEKEDVVSRHFIASRGHKN